MIIDCFHAQSDIFLLFLNFAFVLAITCYSQLDAIHFSIRA